jgi:hypothetical protein
MVATLWRFRRKRDGLGVGVEARDPRRALVGVEVDPDAVGL